MLLIVLALAQVPKARLNCSRGMIITQSVQVVPRAIASRVRRSSCAATTSRSTSAAPRSRDRPPGGSRSGPRHRHRDRWRQQHPHRQRPYPWIQSRYPGARHAAAHAAEQRSQRQLEASAFQSGRAREPGRLALIHHNEKDEWLRFGAAIYLQDVKGADLRGNRAVGGMNGLLLVRTDGAVIRDNTFSFNSGLASAVSVVGRHDHPQRARLQRPRLQSQVLRARSGIPPICCCSSRAHAPRRAQFADARR